MKTDKAIVECAKRLVAKLTGGKYYTLNGEFSPAVKKEINRMAELCNKKALESDDASA